MKFDNPGRADYMANNWNKPPSPPPVQTFQYDIAVLR